MNKSLNELIVDIQSGLAFALWPIFIFEVELSVSDMIFQKYKFLLNVTGFVIVVTSIIVLEKITGCHRIGVYRESVSGMVIQALIILLSCSVVIFVYFVIAGYVRNN
ncbi:MAG: hypothetical protein KAU21_14160 [Gammaproteobacteria bacterium]|nr:hypothetical protein [Gammaproteobacteria bacterium]